MSADMIFANVMKDLEWRLGIYKEEWKKEKERENYDIERDLCISVRFCMYVENYLFILFPKSHIQIWQYHIKIK